MNNVINLNRFRKKRKRADGEKHAEENRAKFGRTKEQKQADAREASKAADYIDHHKLEDDER